MGQTFYKDTMAYYWSATCHDVGGTDGTDTYDSQESSGCSNHNDYVGSKIRSALEEYALNYLNVSDLKEVDQYLDLIISDYETFFRILKEKDQEKEELLDEIMSLKQENRNLKTSLEIAKSS